MLHDEISRAIYILNLAERGIHSSTPWFTVVDGKRFPCHRIIDADSFTISSDIHLDRYVGGDVDVDVYEEEEVIFSSRVTPPSGDFNFRRVIFSPRVLSS